jgi:hypothetical protein
MNCEEWVNEGWGIEGKEKNRRVWEENSRVKKKRSRNENERRLTRSEISRGEADLLGK